MELFGSAMQMCEVTAVLTFGRHFASRRDGRVFVCKVKCHEEIAACEGRAGCEKVIISQGRFTAARALSLLARPLYPALDIEHVSFVDLYSDAIAWTSLQRGDFLVQGAGDCLRERLNRAWNGGQYRIIRLDLPVSPALTMF